MTKTSTSTLEAQTEAMPPPPTRPRDWRFWLLFVSLTISLFIAALEMTAVSTALPVIINDFNEEGEFIWVGSAYALAATAFLPLSGGLAQAFGRRPVMLGGLLIFAAGSAVCGASPNLSALIVGRTVQGLGGGGIAALAAIILSDLVSLQERGTFNGLMGIAWSIASGIGPVVGGSLAQTGQWRWLFYLNLPICGVAATLVILFCNLPTPPGTVSEKLKRIDYIGNALVVASTSACVIGLTWGGERYPWSDARILAPLVLGLVGVALFLVYEVKMAKNPMVPFSLMATRTGVSGYLQTAIVPILLLGLIYYLPVYFQACHGASPIASGVDMFGLAFSIAPVGIIAGATVAKSGRYRPQLWLAWVLSIIGCGLLTLLDADSPRSQALGFTIIVGAGMGIVMFGTYFPVLAPISVEYNAQALAFFTFLRNFAQIWGVTIGGAILQNELKKNLPATITDNLPGGSSTIAYSFIPKVADLPEPLRTEVRVAFADSLRVLYQVLVGIAGLGLLSSSFMKGLPLHTSTDRQWALEQKLEKDIEKGSRSDE